MDSAGEELLAGPRLTLKENRGARAGGHRHRLEDAPDLAALADDLAPMPELGHLAAEVLVLPAESGVGERLGDGELELLALERLLEVVDRPRLDRRHRVVNARIAGEHDQGDVIALAHEEGQELDPRQPRHLEVGDDQVDPSAGHLLQGIRDARGDERRVACAPERPLERGAHRGVVVHAEDGRHRRGWRARPGARAAPFAPETVQR